MSVADVSLDRFLGGRVIAAQPVKGFRAGHDSVLIAAAVPADAHSHVLELGSGAGVASLCLAARVPAMRVTGIEMDVELVQLANDNAARNSMADRVRFIASDVASIPALDRTVDHVFFNPPFHPDSSHRSPSAARDRAMRDSANAIGEWTRAALAAVRSGGTVTAIVRADRVDDIVAAAGDSGGVLFPLLPRAGAEPKRIIVRIVKGGPPTFVKGLGLVLHAADGPSMGPAEAVLRHGAALDLAP